MACASCGKKSKGEGYYRPEALKYQPYNANDLMLYELGEVRKLAEKDWSDNRHKLLLFIPQVNTPVCESEFSALAQWIDEFDALGCDVYGATTDPIHMVKDWVESESTLKNTNFKILSSYLLPTRLGIMNNGRAMRSSVFVTKDADVIIQHHFMKVGRSLKELHRTLYAYTTGSYCGEGWEDPSDGFLVEKNASSKEA